MDAPCFQFSSMTSILELGVALNLGYSALHQISARRSSHLSIQIERLAALANLFDPESDDHGDYSAMVREAKFALFSADAEMEKFNRGVTVWLLGFSALNVLLLIMASFPGPSCDPAVVGVLSTLVAFGPSVGAALLTMRVSQVKYEPARTKRLELTQRVIRSR